VVVGAGLVAGGGATVAVVVGLVAGGVAITVGVTDAGVV
jgi:hypothetical protein